MSRMMDTRISSRFFFSTMKRLFVKEWISGPFLIQQLPEFLRTGYLDRRAKQRFKALDVVNRLNASSKRMRRREIESSLQYGEDTLPEPLLNALFDTFFDPLLDALPGKVLCKG